VQGNGMASAKQLALPLESPGDEPVAGNREDSHSVQPSPWMVRVLSRDNLNRALKQVRRNKGAPGIDGMTVDELPDYLRQHWPEIRQQLLQQSYRPKPVRRVTIPKANGGSRPLGIPTVLDRFIQQAIAQVIQQDWEPRFTRTAMASARGALRIKRFDTDSAAPGKVAAGWWIWTWKPSLTG
jgi:RNA-directed DNA polymerase